MSSLGKLESQQTEQQENAGSSLYILYINSSQHSQHAQDDLRFLPCVYLIRVSDREASWCFRLVVGSTQLEVQQVQDPQDRSPSLCTRYTETFELPLFTMSKIEQDFQKASKEFQRLQAGELRRIPCLSAVRVLIPVYCRSDKYDRGSSEVGLPAV
jgi:hypothetical protein